MIIAATTYGAVDSGGGSSSQILYEVVSGTAPTYLEDSETGDWELVFLKQCNILVKEDVDVDVFAVGGGAKGGDVSVDPAAGGTGGKGGQCVTSSKSLTGGTRYQVTIGGSGQSTTAFDVTANSGGGSNGGSGASPSASAGAGTAGSLAFGRATASDRTLYEASLDGGNGLTIYFGAGGGGGGYGTDNTIKASDVGGDTGGGHGTHYYHEGSAIKFSTDGKDGQNNTGAGGGGSGYYYSDVDHQAWQLGYGSGGSGIVIIRNHRT